MRLKSLAAVLFQNAAEMMVGWEYWTAITLIFTAPACAAKSVSQVQQTCGDFLQEWNLKPKAFGFSGCKKIKHSQVDRLEASYLVRGKDAASVERYLSQQFKMAPLRFICCGWETIKTSKNGANQPGYGRYVDKNGHKFEIMMSSEETVLKDWKQISKFNVRVTTYLGSP